MAEIARLRNPMRRKADFVRRESESRFQAIFNQTYRLMELLSPDGRVLEINQAALSFMGIQAKEIINKFLWESAWWSGSPSVQQNVRSAIKQAAEGALVRMEIPYPNAGGDLHLFDFSVKPVFGATGNVDLLIAEGHDISERKRMEEEKIQLNAQLLQARKMESVGRLAGGIAHDFNNMLSAILGHTELALMRCNPTNPLCEDLQAIRDAARRSADLTQQLLAFARKRTIAPKVLEMNKTVSGTLRLLQRLLGANINLIWMPGTDVWPIKMDPSQIDQILTNLCINARDAISGTGKITVETYNISFDEAYCASHLSCARGEYVALIVRDDGCGMSKEVLDHLFEPFFTTKEAGNGTGLGLATIYGIIQQNSGFIRVQSKPAKGTTFKIFLPRFTGAIMETTVEGNVKTFKSQGETVLVVEDEPAILDLYRTMLEKLGYRVLTAGTPSEAIREAKAHASDLQLLITDVVMPEMNGRDLARLISDIRPGLKCLFSSGYTAEAIDHYNVPDTGFEFIQKPFSMQDLALKAREALGC
jgi:two-component system, cell cycle sensor histidine kinase and response regulator CckA